MTHTELQLNAQLVAQSYLLETLLMNLLHAQQNPVAALDSLRFHCTGQLRLDAGLHAETKGLDTAQASDLIASSVSALNDLFDRVASQFEKESPSFHA